MKVPVRKKIKRVEVLAGIRRQMQPLCPNCGEPGAHFAPPSLGEEGFYLCDHPDHNDHETCEDRAVGCSKHCACCMGELAIPLPVESLAPQVPEPPVEDAAHVVEDLGVDLDTV